MKKRKMNTIDLFAGCGGLMEGFEQTGHFRTVACVEWEKAPLLNLKNRLMTKWGYENTDEIAIRFDIQRTEDLLKGWQNDADFGSCIGMDAIVKKHGEIDLIIGGPPCQAYSVAGRIRDVNGMKEDYRNYLFESYLKIVNRYKPKAIVFENVQGMLSAAPDGTPIINKIRQSFLNEGYMLLENFSDAVFDVSEYGIPQKRKRVVIFAVKIETYGDKSLNIVKEFYNVTTKKQKVFKQRTVQEAISDLPKLLPSEKEYSVNGKKYSHESSKEGVANHISRFHSKRDIEIFKLLTKDIEDEKYKYIDTKILNQLYFEKTGKVTNVHKYHVLRRNLPSNTIPAHLYKDGLRHIHPDSSQARTITVREAARLQTFPDDYIFQGGMMEQYRMIGNAVPPLFSKVIATAVKELLEKYEVNENVI